MDLPRHGGHLDPEGQLVLPRPGEFLGLQEDLQRFHPKLQIAFDRADGFWSLIRQDEEIQSVSLEWDGTSWSRLSWNRPFHTIIYAMAWGYLDEGNKLQRAYRDPGPWIFGKLERYRPQQFDFDNTDWFNNALPERKKTQEEAARKKTVQDTADLVEDWSSVVDLTDPGRFKPSIVVPPGVPKKAAVA